MRKALLLSAVILILPLVAWAQRTSGADGRKIQQWTGVPSGSCDGSYIGMDVTTAQTYVCDGGSWVLPFASRVGGILITGTPAVGQVPISTSSTAAAWGDPIVSGPDATGAAPTKNPVFTSGWDGTSIRNFLLLSSSPVGTEYGLVTRNIPSGTQPVSGTITTSPPANASTNLTQWAGNTLGATSNYGTSPGAVAVPGVNAFITNTPTVTANAGTNLNTSALALDASVTGLHVAQGSTTAGQNGDLIQGAVTTAAPSYTTAKTSPLSLNTSGGLRVDGSGVTQPVSGTVTTTPPANASTNVAQWAGGTLGATSNYGTSPGAVAVPGVNAFITNIPHAIIDSGSTTAVTGNVTVVQTTGTNLHAVLDTTSTTAVTQATGTNLHSVTDSGSVTAATLSAETTKVIGTVRATGNVGGIFDTTQNAAVAANSVLQGCNFTT